MRAVLPAEMSSAPPTPPPSRRTWLRLALSVLSGTLLSLAGLAAALALNYLVARRCLKVEERAAPLSRIAGWMAPVETPVVLSIEGYGEEPELRRAFLRAVGLSGAAAARLPDHHPLLAGVEPIARYNPYPPLLEETRGPIRAWMTFGYLDADGVYRQVTHYGGETDTTPSPFVQKARGAMTRSGDYYVSYTVYGWKDPQGRPFSWNDETGEVEARDPRDRDLLIDRIDWSAYAGGSFDGLEEIGFAIVATLVEAVAAYLAFVTVKLRRFRRERKGPGAEGPA